MSLLACFWDGFWWEGWKDEGRLVVFAKLCCLAWSGQCREHYAAVCGQVTQFYCLKWPEDTLKNFFRVSSGH